jgi:hypothetical protein
VLKPDEVSEYRRVDIVVRVVRIQVIGKVQGIVPDAETVSQHSPCESREVEIPVALRPSEKYR